MRGHAHDAVLDERSTVLFMASDANKARSVKPCVASDVFARLTALVQAPQTLALSLSKNVYSVSEPAVFWYFARSPSKVFSFSASGL